MVRGIFFWSLIILSFSGCRQENPMEDPEFVAREFMDAMKEGDFERAKQFATRETQASIEMQERLHLMGYNPFRKEISISHSDISGQHAKVWFTRKGSREAELIKLRKTGHNEWRVRMSKADPASEPGVDWAWDWMKAEVPIEKQWEMAPEVPVDSGPQQVAHQFLTALKEDRFNDARDLTDRDTRLNLNLHHLAGDWINPFLEKEFKITFAEETGDSARIIFRQRSNNIPRELNLVREGEVWKVHLAGSRMRDFALQNLLDEVREPLKSVHDTWEEWKGKVEDWVK